MIVKYCSAQMVTLYALVASFECTITVPPVVVNLVVLDVLLLRRLRSLLRCLAGTTTWGVLTFFCITTN